VDDTTPNQGGQRSANEPNGPDDARLRELALRLAAQQVSRPYTGPGEPGAPEEPQLYVGQFPPDILFAVPLPEGARVIGSVAGSTLTVIYANAPQTPAQSLAFYRDRLQQDGWRPVIPGMSRGGFVPAFGPNLQHQLFCEGEGL
jgi:hypothetical protein